MNISSRPYIKQPLFNIHVPSRRTTAVQTDSCEPQQGPFVRKMVEIFEGAGPMKIYGNNDYLPGYSETLPGPAATSVDDKDSEQQMTASTNAIPLEHCCKYANLEQVFEQRLYGLREAIGKELTEIHRTGIEQREEIYRWLNESLMKVTDSRDHCEKLSDQLKQCQDQLSQMNQHQVGWFPRIDTFERKLSMILQRLDESHDQSAMHITQQQDLNEIKEVLIDLKAEMLELKRHHHKEANPQLESHLQVSDCNVTVISDKKHGGTSSVFDLFRNWPSFMSSSQPEDHEELRKLKQENEQLHHEMKRIKSLHEQQIHSQPEDHEELLRKLKQENEHLHREMKRITSLHEQQIHRLQQELQDMQEKKKCLTGVLMTFKSQTEGEWVRNEPPSNVASKFERLFSTTRWNSADRILKSSSGRALANDIFKVAYEECHIATLKELFKELFCHHEPGSNDTKIAEAQKKCYGQLLCLKEKPLQEIIDCHLLTSKVLQRVLQNTHKEDAHVLDDPKHSFARAAVETALGMVTMQPPMIIDYPPKFLGDHIQLKQSEQWDESLEEGQYTLQYFRPVLYTTFQEVEVSKQAHVGNIPLES